MNSDRRMADTVLDDQKRREIMPWVVILLGWTTYLHIEVLNWWSMLAVPFYFLILVQIGRINERYRY